jgi:hypothetical protein
MDTPAAAAVRSGQDLTSKVKAANKIGAIATHQKPLPHHLLSFPNSLTVVPPSRLDTFGPWTFDVAPIPPPAALDTVTPACKQSRRKTNGNFFEERQR